jgi:hypothetical protein
VRHTDRTQIASASWKQLLNANSSSSMRAPTLTTPVPLAEPQTPRTSTLPARTSTAHAHLHQRSRLRDHPRRQGLAGLAGRACGDSARRSPPPAASQRPYGSSERYLHGASPRVSNATIGNATRTARAAAAACPAVGHGESGDPSSRAGRQGRQGRGGKGEDERRGGPGSGVLRVACRDKPAPALDHRAFDLPARPTTRPLACERDMARGVGSM